MKLKVFRQMSGLSQARLAELLGTTELSIIKYEGGKSVPSRESMLKIYQWSKGAVTPNDFYDLESVAMVNTLSSVSARSQENASLYVGLMSGTSMDGIDAALLMTDGQGLAHGLGSASMDFRREFHDRLKSVERAVRDAGGDLEGARKKLPDFDKIVAELTDLHGEVVEKLLKDSKLSAPRISAVGFHGQTVFHRPEEGITVQLGDGQRLADRLKIPVVFDFRSNDVKHGGQGAPFAPLYHQALAKQSGLTPVAIVNCGGISNVTIITGSDEQLTAFDPGPGNGLIDRLVKERVGKLMDKDGVYGLQGTVNEKVLEKLKAKALVSKKGINYLEKIPPKSLDISDMELIPELDKLSLQDACATLEAFTAECVVDSLRFLEAKGIAIPKLWVLAGGGWNNPVIVRELESRLKRYLGNDVKVQRAEQVGWDGKALEAQIFAYLSARTVMGLPLSVPGTTGVREPLTGGVLLKPRQS